MRRMAARGLMCGLAVLGLTTPAWAEEGARRFRVGAGIDYRQIESRFMVAPASPLQWQTMYPSGGNSDAPVYAGEASLEYDDGTITYDPMWTDLDGTAFYSVDSPSQLTGPVGAGPTAASFHTETHSYGATCHGTPAEVCEDDSSLGAYLEIEADLLPLAGGDLSVLGRYGLHQADISADRIPTGTHIIYRDTHEHTVTYDLDPLGTDTWVVFDSSAYNTFWNDNTQDPRTSTSTRRTQIASYSAMADLDLDVDLQAITLAARWTRKLCDWSSAIVTVGPTINLIDWDMVTDTTWRNDATGAAVESTTTSGAGDDVVVGVSAAIGVTVNLTPNGRVFLQADAGYDWVDTVDAQAGSARAEIDASSVSGSAGLGVAL